MGTAPFPRSEIHARKANCDAAPAVATAHRINSEELFRQHQEVEIDHQGRIYRLRRTQLNKLILTA